MSIRWWTIGLVVRGLIICGGAAGAVPGFVEDFNSGDTAGWMGGSDTYTPVPTGGVGGENDGYLEVANTNLGFLGTHATENVYLGDLTADGVTGFSFWLNDVGTDEELEIHVGVGTAFLNFWLSVDGFAPPEGEWAEYSVDITDSSGWVQIQGDGTFEEAMQNSDRLLFRHDLPPLVSSPDPIVADVGIDRITVLPIAVPCEGDANGDDTVDPLDSGFVLARFGCLVGAGDADCDASDQNGDAVVDPLDVGFVLARFGDCP